MSDGCGCGGHGDVVRLEADGKAAGELALRSVNAVIMEWPATVAVFERYGVDACCGGAHSVAVAAERHGVALDDLMAELQRAGAIPMD